VPGRKAPHNISVGGGGEGGGGESGRKRPESPTRAARGITGPGLKSDSYLFREGKRSRGLPETPDKLTPPPPLLLRFWARSEKSIRPVAGAEVLYLLAFPSSITRSHRSRCS